MNRRHFLQIIGTGIGTVALTACGRILEKTDLPKKPNIIFIMADDLGYQELGCYGQKKIRTPNIDQLAAGGIKFTDYYSGSAVCAPARCNLMTGMHGGHAYVRDNYEVGTWESYDGQLPLPKGIPTLGSLLKNQGYATGAFGKWGLGSINSSGDPLANGFDTFVGYNCQRHAHNLYPQYLIHNQEKMPLERNKGGVTGQQYAPQIVADHMLNFIANQKDRPFFVYYPTVLPHLALQAPQENINEYNGSWDETPYTGKSYVPHPTPRSCYAAMITFIDKQVGRLMRLLKENGLDQDTIIFFTSDNGTAYLKEQVDYEFFESVGPLRGLKGSLYEGGIRVPMIVRWPGKIKFGTVTNHLASHYDVMATLADLSGAKIPEKTDGISFSPTLLSRSGRQKKHEYLFWDFAGYGGQLAVRMGRWKGVKQNLRKDPGVPLELYDLKNDIAEKNNIVELYPEIAEQIESIMIEARTKPEIKQFQFGTYAQ